jgi:hypothetical protein
MKSYDVNRDLAEVRRLRPLLLGLQNGTRTWQEYRADVAGPDQVAAAIELCRAELKAATQRLIEAWFEIGSVAFPRQARNDAAPGVPATAAPVPAQAAAPDGAAAPGRVPRLPVRDIAS